MIIDAHAHIGHFDNNNFTPADLIRLMNENEIDLALISNLEGIGRQTEQNEANEFTRAVVNESRDRFRGLVWVNPWFSEWVNPLFSRHAEQNIRECLDSQGREFVGLKFHPFHNKFKFNEKMVIPSLHLAQEYGVPVAVHTAYDAYSHPDNVIEVAAIKEFAEVNFILYHAGLNPPNDREGNEVIEKVAAQPNLYVDISWVKYERLKQALKIIPEDRILFGTDLPLGGPEHYRNYIQDLQCVDKELQLSDDRKAKLMHENCKRIFTRLAI